MKRICLSFFVVIPHLALAQVQLNLEDALRQSFQNRPLVKSSRAAIESARDHAKFLGSASPWSLELGYSSAPGIGATDQDLALSTTIDTSGKRTATRRLASTAVSYQEALHRKNLLTVQSEVLRNYLQLLFEAQMVNGARDIAAIAESLYKASVRKFEEGKVPEVQTLRALIEWNRAKQTSDSSVAQYKISQRKLLGSLGSSKVDTIQVSPPKLSNPTNGPENHPDILALKTSIAGAQLGANVAKREAAPEFSLQGLRSPWASGTTAWGLRFQMSWKPGEDKRANWEVSSLKKQEAALELELQDSLAKAKAEVTAIQVELQAAADQEAALAAIRTTNLTLVEKAQRGYSEGFGSLLDVLEATRSLREVEQELATAQLRRGLAMAALYEATGTLIVEEK